MDNHSISNDIFSEKPNKRIRQQKAKKYTIQAA